MDVDPSDQVPWCASVPWGFTPKQQQVWNRQVNKEAYLQRGFIRPARANLIPELAGLIFEGDTENCLMVTGYDSENIYVVPVKRFPEKVDEFIEKMSEFYRERFMEHGRYELMVHPDHVQPGIMVAVYFEEEWKRARVGKKVTPGTSETLPVYEVLLVDLGEKIRLNRTNFFYLHGDFLYMVCCAIHVRLPKMDKLYEHYVDTHGKMDRRTWELAVWRKMEALVFDKPIVTHFIQEVESQGKKVWEVELLQFVKQDKKDKRSVEEQLVALAFGGGK